MHTHACMCIHMCVYMCVHIHIYSAVTGLSSKPWSFSRLELCHQLCFLPGTEKDSRPSEGVKDKGQGIKDKGQADGGASCAKPTMSKRPVQQNAWCLHKLNHHPFPRPVLLPGVGVGVRVPLERELTCSTSTQTVGLFIWKHINYCSHRPLCSVRAHLSPVAIPVLDTL